MEVQKQQGVVQDLGIRRPPESAGVQPLQQPRHVEAGSAARRLGYGLQFSPDGQKRLVEGGGNRLVTGRIRL